MFFQGDQARLLIGVPVDLFQGIDTNQDGLLQPHEIRVGRLAMLAQLQAAIDVRTANEPGTGTSAFQRQVIDEQLMVSLPVDAQNSTRQIEWLRVWRVPLADMAVPIAIQLQPQALSTDYVVQVRRFDETETTKLSAGHPAHTFFKGAWATWVTFAELGARHILTGLDHLVFLVLVLISSIALKRWLIVLTSFTLAHGITYALATYGVVYVKPELIEPVIAFTIVLAAVAHLRGWRPQWPLEAAIIFSLGLFHGLGFAGAMSAVSKELRFPVESVLGFNIGVELGQIALALLLWLVLSALKPWQSRHLLAQWVAWGSVFIGTYWLVERIFFN